MCYEVVWGGFGVVWGGLVCFGVFWGVSTADSLIICFVSCLLN